MRHPWRSRRDSRPRLRTRCRPGRWAGGSPGVRRALVGHYERVQHPRWLCTQCPAFTARNHRGFIAMCSDDREAAQVRWVKILIGSNQEETSCRQV